MADILINQEGDTASWSYSKQNDQRVKSVSEEEIIFIFNNRIIVKNLITYLKADESTP